MAPADQHVETATMLSAAQHACDDDAICSMLVTTKLPPIYEDQNVEHSH